jgi:hypothetical protein
VAFKGIIQLTNVIKVQGKEITVIKINEQDYISLTDMLKAKDGDFFISDWLRNRNTIEFIGIWEKIYNPNFNYGEFAIIKSQVGLNNYKISAKEWAKQTNAVGLVAKTGRYGGTYAHKDIAFEFGMWISAEFKLYMIKEFQRLKEIEQSLLGWDIKRSLTKINYRIHTEAIKQNLIPKELSKAQINHIYASEADILNMALYGMTAAQWREQNPNKDGNIRDESDVSQLVCLANLEILNAMLINDGLPQNQRLIKLNNIAIEQMKILTEHTSIKRLHDSAKSNMREDINEAKYKS